MLRRKLQITTGNTYSEYYITSEHQCLRIGKDFFFFIFNVYTIIFKEKSEWLESNWLNKTIELLWTQRIDYK
jgi:hypothetical protein